jgi:hypothetical protein
MLSRRSEQSRWTRPSRRRAQRRARAVHRPLRNREAFVLSKHDGVLSLHVQRYLAFKDEKELVLIDMLVPGEISLENSESNNGIVDRRQRLIVPRRVGRHLAWNIDNAQHTILYGFVVSKVCRQLILHNGVLRCHIKRYGPAAGSVITSTPAARTRSSTIPSDFLTLSTTAAPPLLCAFETVPSAR